MFFTPVVAVIECWRLVQKLVESGSFGCAGNSSLTFVD